MASRYFRWAQEERSATTRIGTTLLAGPVFLGLLPFLIAWVGLRVDRRLGLRPLGMRSARRIVGGLLMVLGYTLGFWSVVTQVDRGRGTPLPVMPTQELLTEGPFRFCRNPMTLGTILAYFGLGIGAGTVAGTAFALGFGASLLAYLKRFEEAELAERFGEAYLAYKHEVPFIIPSRRPSKGAQMKRVLVLGGGIGGVEAAISLRKKDLDVELVSDRDYLFVYPLAIWIPTGERSFENTGIRLADVAKAHGFKLTIDEVTEISGAERSFTLAQQGKRQDFDYLVVALGAHKMPHKGKEHVLSICGAPQESLRVKERLDALIARGEGRIAVGFGGNPKDTSAVRGGPAFEFLYNVHHTLIKRRMRSRFELSFFAPMPSPGMRMGEKAVAMMDRMLDASVIRAYTGKKISEFVEGGVVFEDGGKLEADLIMFIAAGDGHSVVKASDLPQNEAGFISVLQSCEVRGHPWLYAVGDAAALEGPEWRAKQGHVAEVMARITANDIARKESGDGRRSESYVDDLCILCVMDMGNGAGFVYRNDRRALFLPMPIVGHWLKRGWGKYFELSKLGKIPRIPGM